MKNIRPLTIFLDIDGCIFPHPGHPNNHLTPISEMYLLPGVKEKFNEWIMKDYKIILVTGRKECTRNETVTQLKNFGITWDQLIMGIGGGNRILINDTKPNSNENTATAYTIKRNQGMSELQDV